MTSRSSLALLSALLAPSFLVLACGGSVTVPGNEGGGSSSSSGTGGASATTSTSSSTSSSTSTSSSGAGGSSPCDAITSEVDCLGAFPACVPVYDDKCCPSCDPVGGCADCVDIHFHHCAAAGVGCVKGPCAAPPWACAGTQPDCAIDPGASATPCHSVAGCTAAHCPTNVTCEVDPVCVPVTKGSCTNECDAIPPPCPPGTIAEQNGFCHTGLCIPAEVCAP